MCRENSADDSEELQTHVAKYVSTTTSRSFIWYTIKLCSLYTVGLQIYRPSCCKKAGISIHVCLCALYISERRQVHGLQ